jgi:hypothetical protein
MITGVIPSGSLEVSSGETFDATVVYEDIDKCTEGSRVKKILDKGPYRFEVTSNAPTKCSFKKNENGTLFLPNLSVLENLSGKPVDKRPAFKFNIRVESIWTGSPDLVVTIKISDENPNIEMRDPSVSSEMILKLRQPTCASKLTVVNPVEVYQLTAHLSPYQFDLVLGTDAPPAYTNHLIQEKVTFVPLFATDDLDGELLLYLDSKGLSSPSSDDVMTELGLKDFLGGAFIANNQNRFTDNYFFNAPLLRLLMLRKSNKKR